MPIEFINADLEITSSEDLTPIKEAFEQSSYEFVVMYCGEIAGGTYLASFEVHPDNLRDDQSAAEKIHAFCDSIGQLQGFAKEVWNRAGKRVIDLGYQSDDHCEAFVDRIPLAAIRRLEELRIELALTIYPKSPLTSDL